jgi:DnaJ-class molecular chaperone
MADPASGKMPCPGCEGRGRWREKVFENEPEAPVTCDRCSGTGEVAKAPSEPTAGSALTAVKEKAAAEGITLGPVCKECGETAEVVRTITVNPDAVDRYRDENDRLHHHSRVRKQATLRCPNDHEWSELGPEMPCPTCQKPVPPAVKN